MIATKVLNKDNIKDFLTINGFNSDYKMGLGIEFTRFMTMCPDGIERFSKKYYSEKYQMLIIHDFEKHVENHHSYPQMMFSSQNTQLQNEISIYSYHNSFILSMNKSFKCRLNLNQINSVELFELLKIILGDQNLQYFQDDKPHWEYSLAGIFNPIKIYPPIYPQVKDFDIMEYLLNNMPGDVSTIQPVQMKDNYSNFTALKSNGDIIKVIFKK